MLANEGSDIGLTRLQGNQSAIACVGDGDNSLNMRHIMGELLRKEIGQHAVSIYSVECGVHGVVSALLLLPVEKAPIGA
jgi:hypothetical protein